MNLGNSNQEDKNDLVDENITDDKIWKEALVILNDRGDDVINLINEYTKYDPTLPRTTTIRCPNQKCDSNKNDDDSNREILYIRNNDINMDYVYLCAVCDTTWKNK